MSSCTACGKVFPRMEIPIWCPDCGRLISTEFVMGGFNFGGFGYVSLIPRTAVLRKPQLRDIELREIGGWDDVWALGDMGD